MEFLKDLPFRKKILRNEEDFFDNLNVPMEIKEGSGENEFGPKLPMLSMLMRNMRTVLAACSIIFVIKL